MGAEEEGGKRVFGPRPVGAVLPALTRPVFRHRSPAAAQIMLDWPLIVGPALAAVTSPRRLVGGALTLACAGPIALELQHMAVELVARINGHLGRAAVERLRFVQDAAAPAGPSEGSAHDRLEPPAPLDGLPPGELNAALGRLGQRIASRSNRKQQ